MTRFVRTDEGFGVELSTGLGGTEIVYLARNPHEGVAVGGKEASDKIIEVPTPFVARLFSLRALAAAYAKARVGLANGFGEHLFNFLFERSHRFSPPLLYARGV